jgi:DNA polymerase-3 subunit epsilon
MVKDAPPFEAVAPQIADFIGDAIFVAHNVRFDYGFVSSELRRTDQEAGRRGRSRDPLGYSCATP